MKYYVSTHSLFLCVIFDFLPILIHYRCMPRVNRMFTVGTSWS